MALISGMSCSITIIEQPVASRTRSSTGPSASVSRWATPDDGSSSSRTAGRCARTHARSTMRRLPGRQFADQLLAERPRPMQLDELVDPRPHRELGLVRRREPQRGGEQSRSSRWRSSATAIVSATVSDGKRRASWNERPRPRSARRKAAASVTSLAEQEHPSAVDGQEARHAVDQRRLAGAVLSDEPEDLAVVQLEVDSSTAWIPPKRFTTLRSSSTTCVCDATSPPRTWRGGRRACCRPRRRGTPSAGCRADRAARRWDRRSGPRPSP